jgi:photosystem II stability/assembly factor-like uncharacterized protein
MKPHSTLTAAFALAFLAAIFPAATTAKEKEPTWTPIGLSGGGGMFSPAISPVNGKRTLVHCDMGGAYYSDDGGRNWHLIHHTQLRGNTQCRPAFHPREELVVFSASGWNGRTLKISSDGGATWSDRGELPAPLRGEIAIDASNPRLMLAGAGESVARSRDGGKTWGLCETVSGKAVGFHFDKTPARGHRACFAATDRGIWRSDNGGLRWRSVTEGLPSREILSFSGGSSAKGRKQKIVLYCSVPSTLDGGTLDGGVYRSTDRGATWQRAMGPGINVDRKAFDRWAMGEIAQYRWVLASDAAPDRVYAFNSNTGVAQSHHATVYRSDDGGRHWRATFNPDPRWEPTNVDKYYVVAEDNQFYQGVPYGMAIDGGDADHLMFVTSQMFITEDGGDSWFCGFTRLKKRQKKPTGNVRAPGLDWICNGLVVTTTWNYYFDPFDPHLHFIAYTDIGLARAFDGGKSWRWWSEKGRAPWRNTCYELAFDPAVRGRVWGAFSTIHDIPNANIISGRHRSNGPGGICVSDDHGATWDVVGRAAGTDGPDRSPAAPGCLPEAPAISIVVDRSSSRKRRTLYAGFFGRGVFRSDDGGKSWRAINEGLGHNRNMRVTRVFLHRDGSLFAVITALRDAGAFRPEGCGLYRSGNGGGSWTCLTEGERFFWPKDFTVDPDDSKTIYLSNCDARGTAGADKGGLWRTVDGGRSWKRLAREGREHFGAYLHPDRKKHADWIYMTLTENAPGAGLWLSKNNGRTFEPIEAFPFRNAQRVVFPPKGSPHRGKIFVTTFGASVWLGPEG